MIIIFSVITHIDTLLNYIKSDIYDFTKDNKNFHVDLVKMKKANIRLAVFAIFVNPNLKASARINKTLELIDIFQRKILSQEDIFLVKNYHDLIKIYNKKNKIGVILAIEGGASIFNISTLKIFYKMGVRILSLTWNERNQLADGASIINNNKKISNLGIKVLKEMKKLNMILDISHLSAFNFWEIIKNWEINLFASHSNVKKICNHPRNLDDKQLRAIKKVNGLIGINFYPPFLNKNLQVDINSVVKHIDYIKELIGVDYVALGTDFDGIEDTPYGLENLGQLNNLENALRKRGYNEEEIKKVFYLNAIRYFENSWR